MPRVRLDSELFRRGMCDSRAEAATLIAEGRVQVNGAIADKASRAVAAADAIVVTGPPPRFVSRGGLKLDHALDVFDVKVDGQRCCDVGASTGGFTDCLLQRGAASVVAIDVGRGQLHRRLASDPRVTSYERLHVRDAASRLAERFPVLVADLSFISAARMAEPIVGLASQHVDILVLVKPQFEVGREHARAGKGVITDPDLWEWSVERVVGAFAETGLSHQGTTTSPIHGADGNTEFLCWFTR